MKPKNPYDKLDRLIKVMRVQDLEVKLKHAREDYERESADLEEIIKKVAKDMDPFMRKAYASDPQKLAEWEEVMHDYESIEEEEGEAERENPSTPEE